MSTKLRWTTRDLDIFPQPLDDTRYEIISGDLKVSRQPHIEHQRVCGWVWDALNRWSLQTRSGEALFAPGIIFADDDNVAPDVVWASVHRLRDIAGDDGKLHAAPELVVEVLSPGDDNAHRDREAKLSLYSRQGVSEYWIVDWIARSVDVFQRDAATGGLRFITRLGREHTLKSPLLPGFALNLTQLFSLPNSG